MSSPAFIQEQPRSLGVPIMIALVVLAAAAIAYSMHMRQGQVEITAKTAVIETQTVYKSDSMVMAPPHTEIVLFIAPAVTVANHTKIPVTVNDFQLTYKEPGGAQLTANPMSPAEIASAELSFPQLKPALTGTLLRREQEVAPGGTLAGTLLFSMQLSQKQWDARGSAELNVDIYNQPAVLVPIR